jgi:GH25 family lysozyme M1 (1,4-beta-N-acetylmuramidase)
VTIFGIDASSYQGRVNWAAVDALTAFGSEKVTEGTGYTNPFWLAAKAAMQARAKATGFIPLAYHFLDAGPGAAQADHFAAVAGNLTGFGIVLDFERAPNGPPSRASAVDCVNRLRHHYPGHPIGLYAPRWFTGNGDLTFGSWTWASSYVSGKDGPAALYGHVPASWWAAYGGHAPVLLQFTETGIVPGVSGLVDISAFRGTPDQLRAIVLPHTTPLPPRIPEDAVLLNRGQGAVTPVAIPKSADSLRFLAAGTAELEVTFHGSAAQDVSLSWAAGSHSLTPPKDVYAALVKRKDAGSADVAVVAQ